MRGIPGFLVAKNSNAAAAGAGRGEGRRGPNQTYKALPTQPPSKTQAPARAACLRNRTGEFSPVRAGQRLFRLPAAADAGQTQAKRYETGSQPLSCARSFSTIFTWFFGAAGWYISNSLRRAFCVSHPASVKRFAVPQKRTILGKQLVKQGKMTDAQFVGWMLEQEKIILEIYHAK